MNLTTIPMPGMPMAPAQIRPALVAPAPYRPGPSPFMAQPRPRMGQIFGSRSVLDHPAIALALDAGAISIALLGTKQFKTKTWRTIAWITLIASGVKAVNDLTRLLMPATVVVPPAVPVVAPAAVQVAP